MSEQQLSTSITIRIPTEIAEMLRRRAKQLPSSMTVL
jgi:hypothetical protein